MITESKLRIFKVETFGAVDGPGVRLVIFSQGCPLRCKYCHNPESWSVNSDGCWKVSALEIINLYEKNASFYRNGGITISGGEPTFHLDFLIELAKETKKRGIHLAIDTSGFFFNESNYDKFQELIKYVDLWLIDIKHIKADKYELVTGAKGQHELKFIKYLESSKKKYWVRQVLVPGLTDDKDDLTELGLFISKLKYMDRFELLPYHDMAKSKYENLNIEYFLENTKIPTKEGIKEAMSIIKGATN